MIKLKPERKITKIVIRNPELVEYLDKSAKSLNCTHDEYIIKILKSYSNLLKTNDKLKKS